MSEKSIAAYRDQVVAVAARQYSYRDHDFTESGSLASQCRRCGLEFALVTSLPRLGWAGYPCREYSRNERFAIDRAWYRATQ